MDMLQITGLDKRFGDKNVLCGLTLSIPEHSVFGFVGRNGAGKTTTMKLVLGLLRPDAGEILVSGENVTYGQTSTNRYIGYLPDVPEFYSYMTPTEYLKLCGEICGMKTSDIKKRSARLLELVGLASEHHRIKGFSRGMKQRLGIAQALLNSPKLLICDEPTSALDPVGRKEILDILLLAREETTILFSTHILSDVERICTNTAFLTEGSIAMQGTVSELKKLRPCDDFLVELSHEKDGEMLVQTFKQVRRAEKNIFIFSGTAETMSAVLQYIADNQIAIQKIERMEPTLESLFLEVTKS